MVDEIEQDVAEDDRRYRAPALEKGLDIVELLAAAAQPMSFAAIADRLDRSRGELHRMVQVLQFRGYIEQESGGEGYRLTDRLFSLGMRQPRTRNLVEVSLPLMRQLAEESGESCHLAVHSRGEMVVVARVESGDQLGFSVRVGYRRPIWRTASGAILYAFQPPDVRVRWEALFDPAPAAAEMAAFRDHAAAVRSRRVEQTPSSYVEGVIDLSAPVLRGEAGAAALTVPYLERRERVRTVEEVADMVAATADRISERLVETDDRI